MISNLAYISDAISSSVARLVRLGATVAGAWGSRKRQAESGNLDGPVYFYLVGIRKWQLVGVPVRLVFGHIVM